MKDATTTATPETTATEAKSGNVIPRKFRQRYREQGHASHCGDEFVDTFKHCLEIGHSLQEIGELNGIDTTERWGHLNRGMRRMNLGNVLRGQAKRGQAVKFPIMDVRPIEQD